VLNTVAMIGPETLPIVLIMVLLLFGANKVPELMRGIGQGVGELQRHRDELMRTVQDAVNDKES
jgi:sec-independent protein translocase protein TatA